MDENEPTPLWVRAIADPHFREELIADPLRAMADHPEVTASGEQIRQLDQRDRDARRELVEELVREVYRRRGPTSGKDHEIRW